MIRALIFKHIMFEHTTHHTKKLVDFDS